MKKIVKKHKDATSKYNGVAYNSRGDRSGKKKWFTQITINTVRLPQLYFVTEREAAIGADIQYLQYGIYEKLNILKPKK